MPSLTVFLTVSDLMSHSALGWFRVIEMHCGSMSSLTVFLTVSDLMSHNALGWFRVVQMHCGFMPSLKVSEDPYF